MPSNPTAAAKKAKQEGALAAMAATVADVTVSVESAKTLTGRFPRFEIPTGVREAFAYLDGLECNTDLGSRILAEWMSEMEIPVAVAIMPLLKPLPKKRGRKAGSGKRGEIIDAACNGLMVKLGRPPSKKEIAIAVAEMTGGHSQVSSIRRDIYRHGGVTKKG